MNQNLSYYNCSLFHETNKNFENFSFIQDELLLKNNNKNNSVFEKIKVEYKCSFKQCNKFDWNKPIGIICVKDSSKLLTYTLNNIYTNNIFNYLNFIVVDDRSTEDIKEICKKFDVSYLRVDNNKGFNFSMLNNIAAKICYDNGVKQIVLWNSDLFAPDEKQIPELLDLHFLKKSIISGTKLVYPPFAWNNEKEESHNIQTHFPNKINSYRGTIQFGGSKFSFNPNLQTYFPDHFCRFKEPTYFLASENRLEKFITGAFQIIDLKWFIENGGLNPSLSLNFQDVDLCLKAYKQNQKVYYFGENNFLFHDESVTISKSKNSTQFVSDHMIYSKIWNHEEYNRSVLKYE